MDISIGNKIKQLRKSRGLTQEQLADAIGISFQAVSKWENNIGLPDITIIPAIAKFFSVSIYDLFGFNLDKMNSEIESICEESCKYRENELEKGCKIIYDGLKKYPDNDLLLSHLLYAQNYARNPDKVIKTAYKILELTESAELEYDAYRFLAYAYHQKGDDISAKEALDKIPELYFTALTEKAYLFNGEDKFSAADKQKWISFEHLIEMMYKLFECYDENQNTPSAIRELEAALKIIDVLTYDDKISSYDNYKAYFEKQLANLKTK